MLRLAPGDKALRTRCARSHEQAARRHVACQAPARYGAMASSTCTAASCCQRRILLPGPQLGAAVPAALLMHGYPSAARPLPNLPSTPPQASPCLPCPLPPAVVSHLVPEIVVVLMVRNGVQVSVPKLPVELRLCRRKAGGRWVLSGLRWRNLRGGRLASCGILGGAALATATPGPHHNLSAAPMPCCKEPAAQQPRVAG